MTFKTDKDKTKIIFWIDKKAKDRFFKACYKQDTNPTTVLKGYIKRYTKLKLI